MSVPGSSDTPGTGFLGSDVNVARGADAFSAFGLCGPACWTPVPCPECGSALPPRGRSVPLAMHMADCCERHRYDAENKRHLWTMHDEERWRFNPKPDAEMQSGTTEPEGDSE